MQAQDKVERQLSPKGVTINLHISKGTLSKKAFFETLEPSKMAMPDKDPLTMQEQCDKKQDKDPLTMKATCESVIKKDKVPSIKKVRIRFGRKEQRQDQLTMNFSPGKKFGKGRNVSNTSCE